MGLLKMYKIWSTSLSPKVINTRQFYNVTKRKIRHSCCNGCSCALKNLCVLFFSRYIISDWYHGCFNWGRFSKKEKTHSFGCFYQHFIFSWVYLVSSWYWIVSLKTRLFKNIFICLWKSNLELPTIFWLDHLGILGQNLG